MSTPVAEDRAEAAMNQKHSVESVKERIRHALTLFPILSRSGIQTAIGPAIPNYIWSPVLDQMLESGEIIHHMSSVLNYNNRTRLTHRYYLTGNHEALVAADLLYPSSIAVVTDELVDL